MLSLAEILVGSAVSALSLYLFFELNSRGRHYAPGPRGYPIIGNILDVSPLGPWIKFTEYKARYGNLIFFYGLGNNVLVLNSLKAMNDLLDKQGGTFSHRPAFTVVGELMGLGQSMALLEYGNEWRTQRKLAHMALSPTAVKKYYVVQEDLAVLLCKGLLITPKRFFDHVRLVSSRIILSITYGLTIEAADDEYITHADDTMRMIGKATVPGAFLCDLVPILKYLPSWVPFRRRAEAGKELIERLVSKPFNHVVKEMAQGNAPPSLLQDLFLANSGGELGHQLKWSTGSMYGGALFSGLSNFATILTFIMAMALYPETQRLAQAEIDKIVGTERLPMITDMPNLPYVNAVVKETMRWHPALPLGIARRTSEDSFYEGYFIPKNTVVMPNVWCISAVAFEPNDKYDPQKFIPERFINDSDTPNPASWAFGFGRRICPGKHLAENSVFIQIASILAMFDISPPQKGELKPEFGLNLVSYPAEFDCTILPRSEVKAEILLSRASECKL
ncbi:cytochrome P450 [Mycena pura]|uniref:Cytochrome P450 n=1 Tax=Mycena pura TaxID=153505 RepID=A0AAD6YLI5_9AGAR|nr:cytochrome P450 [Mycena pura]